MNKYRQCSLSKGTAQQVAFIPAEFARAGKYLRIGDENGWHVDAVYSVASGVLVSDGRGCRELFGSLQ